MGSMQVLLDGWVSLRNETLSRKLMPETLAEIANAYQRDFPIEDFISEDLSPKSADLVRRMATQQREAMLAGFQQVAEHVNAGFDSQAAAMSRIICELSQLN